MDDLSSEPHGGFDTHVHVRVKKNRLPYIPPINETWITYNVDQAITQAKKVGLDGIAITGHDTFQQVRKGLEVATRHGIVLVPGVEITCRPEGGIRLPHMVGIGIDHQYLDDDLIPRFQDPITVAKWIKDHGGLAIAPHVQPQLNLTSVMAFTAAEVAHLRPHLDAIETLSPGIHPNDRLVISTLAAELNLPQLGASDAHVIERIGLARTDPLRKCETWQDFVAAIRAGEVTPFAETAIPFENALTKRTEQAERQVIRILTPILRRLPEIRVPHSETPQEFTPYTDPEGNVYQIPANIELRVPKRAEQLPIQDRHYLIEIPWKNSLLKKIPHEYRAMFKDALPDLGVRTTDVHVAECFKYMRTLIAEHHKITGKEVNERVVAAALIYHDTGWSKLTDPEVALSLGYKGVKLSEGAIAPKEKHALESEKIAREKLAVWRHKFNPPLTDDEVELVCLAVRWHDKPEEVAKNGEIPEEVKLFVDLDHLWSPTINLWQDTARKGVPPQIYLNNLRRESKEYYVTQAGKNTANRLLDQRQREIDRLSKQIPSTSPPPEPQPAS